MSDSFADLWNSSAPPKPTSVQPKSSASSTPQPFIRRQPDVFSLLASSSAPSSRPHTPQRSSPQPPIKQTNGDAFSDLLSGTLGPNPKINDMTIAERAARVERERSADLQMRVEKQQASAWEGLDLLGGSIPLQPKVVPMRSDATLVPATSTTSPKTNAARSTDGLHLSQISFAQPDPQSTNILSLTPMSDAAWALDDFTRSSTSSPPLPPDSAIAWARDRHAEENSEERLLRHDSDDEHGDILGALGRPVNHNSIHPSPYVTGSFLSKQSSVIRPSSPPPHIVGQLVEMGFSPQQARVALAATDTGMDIQMAMETLLSQAVSKVEEGPSCNSASHEAGKGSALPRNRRQHDTNPSGSQSLQLQEQADRLLAQASELGMTMFNRANAIWSSGRDKALKAYGERMKGTVTPPGQPKWMKESLDAEEDWDAPLRRSKMPSNVITTPSGLFQDPPEADASLNNGSLLQPHDDLLSHHLVSGQAKRKTVVASAEAVSVSTQHKALGNEKFKLGQFAEAETAYSAAIAALPDGHLLLVPLYNNRAAARLKIGDCGGAESDAGVVISIVGCDLDPQAATWAQGSQLNLGEGLTKAWKRRAEALEMREKWADACRDWKVLAGCAWARGRSREEGIAGVERCRRMLGEQFEGFATPHHKSRSLSRPKVKEDSQSNSPGQALADLRKATRALEAEENARFELKDTVDSRLQAWSGGKETNIRALIASLDTVLWPELGWVKVGMGELVSEKQVKVQYMRAIAKLHPDKLNTANTTLEQRMVANGVFGTLNEAWHSFTR